MTTGADIQIEKGGFVRIHNALLEKLALTDLGSYELRLLFYLIRMTYGYQRKETDISLDEWEAGTLLDRRHIVRALKNLVSRKIIHKTSTGTGRGHTTIWGFNKYIEQWLPPLKGALVEPFNGDEKGADMAPFDDDKGCQNMHVKGAKSGTSTTSPKERKKEQQAKAALPLPVFEALKAPEPASDDVTALIVMCYDALGKFAPSDDSQRGNNIKAATELLEQFGFEMCAEKVPKLRERHLQMVRDGGRGISAPVAYLRTAMQDAPAKPTVVNGTVDFKLEDIVL